MKQLMNGIAVLTIAWAAGAVTPVLAQDAPKAPTPNAPTACTDQAANSPECLKKGGAGTMQSGAGDTTKSGGAGASTPTNDGGNAPANKTPMGATASPNKSTSTDANSSKAGSADTSGKASGNAGAATKAGGSVSLTTEQQAQVHQEIKTINVAPVTIDFNVSVGVTVPKTVTLQPLPQKIVQLVPDYSGYLFFVLADGRIVIVRPDTLEIVLIIA